VSVSALETKLLKAEQNCKLPRVLIPVHFAGQSCEMAPIANLARRFGVSVIEDASHAIGGRYREKRIGCCSFSDMTVFSFHPVKIITTGEGGMVLTNKKDFYEKLIRLRSHGITRDPSMMREQSHGPWYYQQIELGFNYRITDIQAALGTSQMSQLDQFVERRRHLAGRYQNALHDMPLTLPWQHDDTDSAWHLYVIRLKLDLLAKTHTQIFSDLRSAGIQVNLHYIPVHTQPYYQQLGFKWGDFPQAEQYYREAISLPMYYGLTDKQQDYVIDTLKKVLK
jgi:dTDP-4-amino-4,6-dideoxygalactose transaminase